MTFKIGHMRTRPLGPSLSKAHLQKKTLKGTKLNIATFLGAEEEKIPNSIKTKKGLAKKSY